MRHLNNSKIFFICLLIFLTNHPISKPQFSATPTDEDRIKVWVNMRISQLSDNNQLLVANMLYLSYMVAQLDREIRHKTSKLMFKCWEIFSQSKQSEKISDPLESLQKYACQLNMLSTEHQQIIESWKQCVTHIETQSDDILLKVVDEYREQIRQLLCDWANHNRSQLYKTLDNCSDSILQSARRLTSIQHLYQEILTHSRSQNQVKEPDLQKSENGETTVKDIDIAFGSTRVLYTTLQQLLSGGESIHNFTQDMQLCTEYFCCVYYKLIYNYLSKSNSHEHLYLLFNPDGFIKPEHRNILLPDVIMKL